MPRNHAPSARRAVALAGVVLCGGAAIAVRAQQPGFLKARILMHQRFAGLVYDVARQRTIATDGADTWEFDGQWRPRELTGTPGARYAFGSSYDVRRQRVVLFSGSRTADTWEWSGSDSWVQRSPATSPPARGGHAMAYDVARGVTVLFGGSNGSTLFSDTWEWDGTDWRRRSPATVPPARAAHAMAYDAVRGRTVLFGGSDRNYADLDDTWEWDGTDWRLLTGSGPRPPARQEHALAFDVYRGRTVLFGGRGQDIYSDTWEWNGLQWFQAQPLHRPPQRGMHGMAYDIARKHVVLFGGQGYGTPTTSHSDTWTWDGMDWTKQSVAELPVGRYRHATTFDLARRCVVMFGGGDNHGLYGRRFGDTWELHGTDWIRRELTPSPSARTFHAMVYDVRRRRCVLFGGSGGTFPYGDTWEFDGVRWMHVSPASSPSARAGHGMAYDLGRGRTVMFGGDTWEWDGASWHAMAPAQSPSARWGCAMAYDARRGRVLLFGGSDYAGGLNDTWEWDGINWSRLQPATSPPAGLSNAMASDFARQRVVLVCGGPVPTEAWEWDGTTWQQTAKGPDYGRDHRIACDAVLRRCVVTGGSRGNDGIADLWLYGVLVPGATQQIGTGCGAVGSLPVLSGEPAGYRLAPLTLDLVDARPNAPVLFGLSASTQMLSLGGGCTLYLGLPITPYFGSSNPFGAASLQLPVPFDATLRGAAIYAQGFVADPAGPTLGLAITAGRRLLLGD